MKILFIASEASPFAKSGGLGDVLGSLPKELTKLGIDIRVMLPLYKNIKDKSNEELTFIGDFDVDLAWRKTRCGVYEIEHGGVLFYFIEKEQYFNRDNFYGHYDDGERFAYFSKAALEVLPLLNFKPDILHCSDWQTALIPVYLKTIYVNNPHYVSLKTVFTIHNIAYQGQFDNSMLLDILGISDQCKGVLDYRGGINFMKGAIVTCDFLTTVSPTYAQEITYPYYGQGLELIISENQEKLLGILNGIDTELFNPYKDKSISTKYSKNSPEKKLNNKLALQRKLGLKEDEKVPVIGMIGRLVDHKGIDLVIHVFKEIMNEDLQLVILGSGEEHYESFLKSQVENYNGRLSVTTGFSADLANQIYAGADIFLMPSLSEPCGLAQMIASRYGTIAIVRETGGLKDSILPYNHMTKRGNGITFGTVNAHDMLDAINRTLVLYQNRPHWAKLMDNAFKTDFSWKKSSKEYIKMYEKLLKE